MSLAQDAAALFAGHCVGCHQAGSETRAPLPAALKLLTREKVLSALETGSMKAQGSMLSGAERLALAAHLSGGATVETPIQAGVCPSSKFSVLPDGPGWNGWGVDLANSRYQPAKSAGLDAEKTARLKLKWALGYPGESVAVAQPVVAGGRLFIGSGDGTVYSLDAKTGCRYWTYKAPAMTRSAISVEPRGGGRYTIYFGDIKANVYALDAETGALLWQMQVDSHPQARVTGAPALSGGRLFVPVSSVEEVPPANVRYACCSFRGSLVAIDARSGKQVWKTYTIPDPPKPTRVNSAGTQLTGPAGAAIWSAPTLDLRRKAVYVATGNSYADPADRHTDAVIAFDMETGSMLWSRQMTPGDGWNFSCINPNKANCPESAGEDLDFGSSPILTSVGGKELLVVGQKSGVVHALDPAQMGKIVWQTRVGRGGALGGVEWGSAADGENIYVALSDQMSRKPEVGGGMFALRLATGEKVWHTPAPKPACLGKPGCTAAQMAAVTVIPGVIFSGSMDGHLRAYETSAGKIIWDYDTLREYETVNGVKARGGSLNAAGPTVVQGMLYVNSGYGALGGMPGNVLLAFAAE
ncbi:MAG TPA: PQQ-binding-like beta-propeller repeat protein [Bryobacteraceae bacterium]|nr:PQQ-binding-like beta-propeller repeat protein [Bryobacteraceae bacterium]